MLLQIQKIQNPFTNVSFFLTFRVVIKRNFLKKPSKLKGEEKKKLKFLEKSFLITFTEIKYSSM